MLYNRRGTREHVLAAAVDSVISVAVGLVEEDDFFRGVFGDITERNRYVRMRLCS